jgi:hypothetical protein
MSIAVDRRSFLGTCTGGLAAFAFGCRRESPVVQGADPLQDIPKKLPGIHSIESYPVSNASKVLIHVRQIHESSIEAIIRSTEQNASPDAIACHQSIRRGVSALLSVYPCDALYLEGLHQADVHIRRRGVALFRELLQGEATIRSNLTSLSAAERELVARQISEGEKAPVSLDDFQGLVKNTESKLDRQSVSHSTATQLAARFGLTIESPNSPEVEAFFDKVGKPIGELEALNAAVEEMGAKARALLQRYGGEQDSVPAAVVDELYFYTESMEKATQKKTLLAVEITQFLKSQQSSVYQLRDEALVSLVSQRPPKEGKIDRVLALWGAAHDLRPVIAAHNAAHPDNQIALVVITPVPVSELESTRPLR